MKKGKIYTVHYGNEISPTLEFIKSLDPFLNENLQLVIINNSKEIDLNNLNNKHISVINTEKNLGYFGAVKYGMEQYPIESYDYIIVCNNDLTIASKDFFKKVDEKLEKWDIIAPSTKTLNNIEQNPHRQSKPSVLRKIFHKVYFSNYKIAWLLEKTIELKKEQTKNSKKEQNEREIFSPHGAFIIISSIFFKRGGYIDDGYFLYGEEDSIAAQAENLKIEIGYVPELEVRHLESISTGRSISKEKYKYRKSAYQYIKNKYPSIYKINK